MDVPPRTSFLILIVVDVCVSHGDCGSTPMTILLTFLMSKSVACVFESRMPKMGMRRYALGIDESDVECRI